LKFSIFTEMKKTIICSRLPNCALTDLKVEYGGSDFTTFKGTNGAPSEMTLQLSFTELEILTADRIEQGY